jgi:hypothetical protein
MTYWFFHIPGLTRSRINDHLHVIPDSDQGSRLSRDTFSLALPAVYFLLWQKKAKTMGRNNHPADSLYRRLCKGGKACRRDPSPNTNPNELM